MLYVKLRVVGGGALTINIYRSVCIYIYTLIVYILYNYI